MARNLYLIRHGAVDFPDKVHRCIGRTDTGLDETGRKQAGALAEYFKSRPLECVFSSPLSRAVETAEILRASVYPLKIKEDLAELDMGEWENLPLKDIKKDLETEPVYGERRQEGRRRFAACIEEILGSTKGDVAVVAHAGINCCYLSGLLGISLSVSRALPQPCGGFSRIAVRDWGKSVEELGRMTAETPSRSQCEAIWDHYHTPVPVRDHCRAVSTLACEYGRRLERAGCPVDMELIRTAALLHDVVRQKKDHPLEGARVVIREGYPCLAPLLLRHHDWDRTFEAYGSRGDRRQQAARLWEDPMLAGFFRTGAARQERFRGAGWQTEAAAVYLADKETQGTSRVTIEERFEKSRQLCMESSHVPSALAAHEKRFREAGRIRDEIQKRLGGLEG